MDELAGCLGLICVGTFLCETVGKKNFHFFI